MKKTILSVAVAAAVPLMGVMFQSNDASAQTIIVGPPQAYVAAYEPIYYNGYAHYWWNNHWYYRDHGAWRFYEHEPAYFHPYRAGWGGRFHHWR